MALTTIDPKVLARLKDNDPTLTTLNLGNNRIGVEGAKAIAEALTTNTTLTTLNLGNTSIGVEGAKAIAEALTTNTTLTTLHLDDNRIGVEGAKAIAEALSTNTTLTTLYLGGAKVKTSGLFGNSIGDEGAKAIAEALTTNTTLTTLYLTRNNIGVEGAKAIAEALTTNTTLTTLHLGGNNIGDEGAKVIAKALTTNTTLTTLHLDNNIGYELLQGIQRLLERNQAIPRPDPASVESKETTASPQSAQESDHCHAVPNPAAAALAYIEAMPQAFPAVFQQRAAIFMRHAALVSAIQGLLEDEDSHPHPPSADAWAHEHDASAEGKVQAPFPSPRPKDPVGDVPATTTAETAAAETATAAAATPTAEHGLLADQTDVPSQVACLQSEVARLLHLYEPGNVSGDSKLPMDATEAATSGPKPKPKPKSKTPMITEAALEDIRQRAVAARKQLEDATAEKDALLTKLKSEWGEMMYNMMVSAMETAAASPTAQPKPSGTLEASLYDAFVAVPQAAAAVERCEAELLEAERVFNQPYSVACRLEQHCERLWQLASPLAAALNIMTPKPAPDQNDSREGANLNGANLNGGGGGGGGGGDVSPKAPKPTKKTGPKPSLRSVLQDLLRLTPTSTVISSSSISINSLLPHQNGADDLSQHMSEQLARLQRDVDRKQQAVREAEKAYTELQAKVSDLLDEDPELIENFNATAATPAGASDARPLVRELHKALQDLQNSRRLCNEATERLRDRMQYLGSIGWVLERVGARIKFLLDLYPATLRALAQRVR